MSKLRLEIMPPTPIEVDVVIHHEGGSDQRKVKIRPVTLRDEKILHDRFGETEAFEAMMNERDATALCGMVLNQMTDQDVEWLYTVSGVANRDHLTDWILGSVSTEALISGLSDVLLATRKASMPEPRDGKELKKKLVGFLLSTSSLLILAAHLVGIWIGLETLPCDSWSQCTSSFGSRP